METQTKHLTSLTNLAFRAWNGTSFSPEKRAKTFIDEHEVQLIEDLQTIPEQYRDGYKKTYIKLLGNYLASHSNVVSSMIAGPSNFPGARMRKRSDWADNHYQNFLNFRSRFLPGVLRREKREEKRNAIAEGTQFTSEIQVQRDKLSKLEKTREFYKAVNAAHVYFLKHGALPENDFSEKTKNSIINFVSPYSWVKHPIAPYQLTNLSAQIGNVIKRIEQLETKENRRENGTREEAFGDIILKINTELDRLQLLFPSKPDEATRTNLKRNGFRWSPREGAWQSYLNDYQIERAKRILQPQNIES